MSNLSSLLSRTVHYPYHKHIVEHVRTIQSRLPSLQPKAELFVHENGKQVSLLVLDGTIPMYYKGNKYNIPVKIWLTEGYPQYPPLVFVVPTRDMELKQNHKHMDPSGRCFLPYLANWKIQTHNLYDLCNFLSSIFGDDPPVFARRNGQRQTPSPANSMTSSHSWNRSPNSFQNSVNNSSYNPVGQTQYQQNRNPPQFQHNFSNSYMNQSQYQPNQHSQYQPSHSSQMNSSYQQPSSQQLAKSELLQRINTRLTSFRSEQSKKFEKTLQDQREQQSRILTQQSEEKRLEREMNITIQQIREICNENERMQEFLEQAKKNQEQPIDEVVTFADPLSKQEIELSAEDAAIDDCIYFLDKALSREAMSSDTFLRNVRQLSRKQFKARALAEKIRSLTWFA